MARPFTAVVLSDTARAACSNRTAFTPTKMFAGMVVVEFMLADEGPGDGGVAVVQGSHKSNYPAPTSLKVGERWQQHVTEVHAKKGDVVIFCEACVHGT